MSSAPESASAFETAQTLRLAGLVVAGLSLCSGTPCTAQGETAEKVVRGISYVGMTVRDVEASAESYSSAADLEEVSRARLSEVEAFDALFGRAGIVVETRLLASTNAQLRLMQFLDSETGRGLVSGSTGAVPVQGPGIAHLCFRADGDNEVYQRFLAGGAKPVGNPEMVTLSPRFPVLYAYALDADGILFEVEHVDIEAMPVNKPEPGFHHIRHVSLGSPDIDRAVSFYSALLATPDPRRGGGDEGFSGEQFDQVSGLEGTRIKMAWFQVGNLELEVIQYLSHPTRTPKEPRPLDAPGYNMIVFDVQSLDAARKSLTEAGGVVVAEAHPMDGGEVLFGRDPDGNLLGFLAVSDQSLLSSSRFRASRE